MIDKDKKWWFDGLLQWEGNTAPRLRISPPQLFKTNRKVEEPIETKAVEFAVDGVAVHLDEIEFKMLLIVLKSLEKEFEKEF